MSHIRSKGVALANLVLGLADFVYLQVTLCFRKYRLAVLPGMEYVFSVHVG